jgi:hypothetical protein
MLKYHLCACQLTACQLQLTLNMALLLLQVAAVEDAGCAAALTAGLWVKIMQHVPQQQRLSQCAMVCKAWASGAA